MTLKLDILLRKPTALYYQRYYNHYFDLFLSGIVLTNKSKSPITLTAIQFNLESNIGNKITYALSKSILHKKIRSDHKTISNLEKMPKSFSMFFSTKYVKRLWVATPLLQPNASAVVLDQQFLIPNIQIKKITLDVSFTVNGKVKTQNFPIKFSLEKTKTKIIMPVKGQACLWGAPYLGGGHHRQLANQEFAFDLLPIKNGHLVKNKNGRTNSFYGYGLEVIAVADGEVVSWADGLRDHAKVGEPTGFKVNMDKLGYEHALAGNFIIIKHSANEFSFYAHLKKNSITIKTGDKVKQGDVIGRLGHSGNSTAPHLHFQMLDKPDFIEGRSIPFTFHNTHELPCELDDELKEMEVVSDIVLCSN